MSEQASRSSRPLWISVACLLLGSLSIWGGSRLTWFAQYVDAGVRGMVLHTESGSERSSALIPLAILILTGVAGLVATSGWLRRGLGVLLVLAGVAAGWVAIDGVQFSGYPDGIPAGEILTGRCLVLLGGLVVIVAGVVVAGAAQAMPRMGAKYSAPGSANTRRDPDTELWDALSHGEDPTEEH